MVQAVQPNIFRDRPWLLFDGAMGTYFAERSGASTVKCEMANCTSPELILQIHREYIEAGADAIKTNTFAANTAELGCTLDTVLTVIERGWELANAAATGRAMVFADIGPIPEGEEGNTSDEYHAILDKFLSLGAKNFLFETFAAPQRVLEAAEYIKCRADATIIASFAVHPDGHTRAGLSGAAIGKEMNRSTAVDAWGFNCISGPLYLHDYVETLGKSGKPLSVMPNAGYPSLQDGRIVYLHNAEYFARLMADIHTLGVTILGGCCGTTPEHIRRTAEALRQGQAQPGIIRQPEGQAASVGKPNHFWEKLAQGRKVIAVEADPPTDAAIQPLLDGVAKLRDAGADIITVADSPLARARADSSMISALVARRCGVDVLPHLACRDRNLNAMKALLLACHIEGIRTILAVTGDPVAVADRSEVKGVFDFNSRMLAGYIRDLNSSTFMGDGIHIGGALNTNAANLDVELKRAERKIAEGVEFFLTQPVYGNDAVEAVKAAKARLNVPILAGILPLVSHRNALFVGNEVPGIRIPADTIERFRGLKRAEAERLGIELAAETTGQLAPYTDGYFIMTPLNRYHVVCELIGIIRRDLID